MQELSDDARAVLDVVRDVHDPNDADRRRLRGVMVARLGAAAVISSSAKLAVASSASSALAATGTVLGAAKWGLAVTLVVAASGLAWREHARGSVREHALAVRAPARQQAPAAASPPASPAAPAAPSAHEELAATSAKVDARSTAKHRSSAASPPTADELSEQVRVLALVRSELRQGHADSALSLLDTEAKRFEHGNLREEYLAARILALRELGRENEAQRSVTQFAEELPRSALLPKLLPQTETIK